MSPEVQRARRPGAPSAVMGGTVDDAATRGPLSFFKSLHLSFR